MATLAALKREAATAAKYRGHKLGKWDDVKFGGQKNEGSIAKCKVCGADVQVLTKPRANEIDIGGPAVAIGCEKPRNITLAMLKDEFPQMTFRLRDGEYRVNFRGGDEATAYYTNDAEDAWHTAAAMLETDSRSRQGQGYGDNPRGDSATMTRQHFEFIARVIRNLSLADDTATNRALIQNVARQFGMALGATNSNFARDRFVDAATRETP